VLVNTVCRALDIHAQLEEEIFYPALQPYAGSWIEKNVPEHDTLRRLIAALGAMDPAEPEFDRTFMRSRASC
jgi:hypothetical protein